jgi:hypothetical protein
MAWPISAFPAAIDVIADKVDGVDYPMADDINGVYDAVEKLEAKMGVDSSLVPTSHDYKIAKLEGAFATLKWNMTY